MQKYDTNVMNKASNDTGLVSQGSSQHWHRIRSEANPPEQMLPLFYMKSSDQKEKNKHNRSEGTKDTPEQVG